MPTKHATHWSYSAQECKNNLPHGLKNILEMHSQALPLEITLGIDWYPAARREARRIAADYNLPLLTVAKVACALSPRLEWTDNMPAAESVIRYYLAGGYVPPIADYKECGGDKCLQRTIHTKPDQGVISEDPRLPQVFNRDGKAIAALKTNIVKALWILQGHDWVLRGPKVNSFLDNITQCELSDAVTVDSHAIQVWFGMVTPGTYSVPENYYILIAADYKAAARTLGITPEQLQAITWLTKKRLSGE